MKSVNGQGYQKKKGARLLLTHIQVFLQLLAGAMAWRFILTKSLKDQVIRPARCEKYPVKSSRFMHMCMCLPNSIRNFVIIYSTRLFFLTPLSFLIWLAPPTTKIGQRSWDIHTYKYMWIPNTMRISLIITRFLPARSRCQTLAPTEVVLPDVGNWSILKTY